MHLLFTALVVARFWDTASALDPSTAFQRIPTAENFWRRAFHAAAVVGDYLIIDGGEEWLVPFGNSTIQQKIYEQTLSIDLSKSWTNASVPYQLINKTNTAPNLNNEKLWPSNDNKSCFVFGGAQSYLMSVYSPPFPSLWQFTVNNTGGGAWTELQAGAGSIFGSLTRPDVARAATVDNTGFIMGGHQDSHSSQESLDVIGDIPIPGIVSYNITSGFWSNDSAPVNISNIFLASVSNFGPSGLLVSAGHAGYSPTAGDGTISLLSIYEPLGKTFHAQSASGKAPAVRDSACSVGVVGDNGTYEIFIYGGVSVLASGTDSDGIGGNLTQQTVDANTALDEVWVLSLPGFAWFKANYTAETNRWRQSCNVVGNRQMVVVGGQDINDLNLGQQSRDPFTQGIGIFDLTEMTWSSGYDAHAAPYVTPQVIKDWYSAGNKANFTDPAVEGFFKSATSANANTSSSSSDSPTDQKTSSNAGAIAGGVVGGLAGLAIIGGLVWFFLRHRRGKRSNQGPDYHPAPFEDKGLSGGDGLDNKMRLSELHGRPHGYEAPELPDSSIRGPVEMQGDNQGYATK